jgi:RNase P subunit RPR2
MGGSAGSSKKDDIVRIMCPKLGCQRILAVPVATRGKLVRCRNCGTNIRVPLKDASRAPAPDSGENKGTKAA